MMKKSVNKIISSGLLFLLALSLQGQVSAGFSYFREINPVNKNGYYNISLDPEILGKSKSDYNDFRVLKVDENDTIENPYFLSWNESIVVDDVVDENIIDASYKKGLATYVTVQLNNPRLINQIKLNISESDFDKLITLEGSYDGKHWKTIKENIRIVGLGSQLFKFSTLYFNDCSFDYYMITVNDKGSNPITINGVQTCLNNEQKAVYQKIKDIYVVKKEIKKDTKPVSGRARNEENYTQIKVTLPGPMCLSTLHLANRDKTLDFYRNVIVCDKKGNELTTAFFTSLEKDGITSIALNKINETELIIKVLNDDNPPLESIDVSVFGMNAFIYTKLDPEEKYILMYGKKGVSLPDYDIGYFSEKVRNNSTNIDCREEHAIKQIIKKKNEPFVKQQKWLWITLIALVILLGLFSFSMMRKVKQ